MSKALERVIEEQQKQIDQLRAALSQNTESSAKMWKQHEELFETLAQFLDADCPIDRSKVDEAKAYLKLRHEVRLTVLNSGYCLRCYNFICECDDYD
jgi:hypothetical protein